MQRSQEEILEIVDRDGNALALALRSKVHGNPSLMHKVVHVLVFNDHGELLLQKRSLQKEVQAGSQGAQAAARGAFGLAGVLAWLAVGVPFLIGVWIALRKAAALF